MSQDLLTLSDLLTINAAGLADIDVSDVLNRAPVLAALVADTASNGTKHDYVKEVGAPVVGFRNPNEGRDWGHSADELVSINLKILDASTAVDKALADIYQKGGWQAYVAREALRHLRAAFFGAERQFFRGTADGDAKGFVGFPDAPELADLSQPMVLGAGGTGDALESVYMIRSTADMADCVVITGQNGEIAVGETVVQAIPELYQGTPTSKTFPGYYTPITGWIGLQLGSAHSIARLCNIDADSATLTDDRLSQMLERFPSAAQPTLIVMSRRSLGQLQRSRTTYSPTGFPAPRPTEYEGIPIVNTDALLTGETEVEAGSSSSGS